MSASRAPRPNPIAVKRRDDPTAAGANREPSGVTLVELLVVLAIIGLLAVVAVPQVTRVLSKAKSDTAAVSLQAISSALDMYRLDVGRFPTEDEGLAALVARPGDSPKWFGPYIKKRDLLVDPWGNDYRYRFPGRHGAYDLFSLGADNAEGGDGEDRDLVNW